MPETIQKPLQKRSGVEDLPYQILKCVLKLPKQVVRQTDQWARIESTDTGARF